MNTPRIKEAMIKAQAYLEDKLNNTTEYGTVENAIESYWKYYKQHISIYDRLALLTILWMGHFMDAGRGFYMYPIFVSMHSYGRIARDYKRKRKILLGKWTDNKEYLYKIIFGCI